MRKRFNRKAIIGLVVFSFLLITASVFLLSYHREEHLFRAFCHRLFVSEMTCDTLSMHYTLKDPASYSICSYQPVLPVYQKGSELYHAIELENYTAILEELSPSKLSEEDQSFYRLLERYLTLQQRLAEYPYYKEPLSPSGGAQTGLPILLADYRFCSEQDVRDYLALLNQYDDYLDGIALYEQEKADAGLFMAEESLNKLLEQCDTIMDADELASGTHFLQTTFRERTQKLVEEQVLSNKKKERYDLTNDRLLQTVVAPAYEALQDSLIALSDQCGALGGLATKPQGSQFYTLYFQSITGSDKTPLEWKPLLHEELLDTFQQLAALLQQHPEIKSLLSQSEAFPLQSADAILQDLSSRMKQDFPALPDQVTCQVKSVSDCLAPYSAPAYYLTPPIDDTSQNVIYINPKEKSSGIELYTVLAHEGFPGHLYQSVYTTRYLQDAGVTPLRYLIGYGGYVEGWALYVELLSYDYASQVLSEHGFQSQALCCEALKLNRRMQLALLSLLDINVHAEGAQAQDVSIVLNNFGITSGQKVYEYLVEEPANYCKYFIGYLEIEQLKKEYNALHPELESDSSFHRFLLECGAQDFIGIRERMQASDTPALFAS